MMRLTTSILGKSFLHSNPVSYPELFWSQYTGLGSQTQTPKCSKVLISGVSFHQRFLSQSQESDVLSYSERKIAKNFQGFAPVPPQTPQLHNGFSPHYIRWKTGIPKKLLDTALQSLVTHDGLVLLFINAKRDTFLHTIEVFVLFYYVWIKYISFVPNI